MKTKHAPQLMAPKLQGIVKGKGSATSDNIPAMVSPEEVILNAGAAKALEAMLGNKGMTIDEFNAMYAPEGAKTEVKDGVLYAAAGGKMPYADVEDFQKRANQPNGYLAEYGDSARETEIEKKGIPSIVGGYLKDSAGKVGDFANKAYNAQVDLTSQAMEAAGKSKWIGGSENKPLLDLPASQPVLAKPQAVAPTTVSASGAANLNNLAPQLVPVRNSQTVNNIGNQSTRPALSSIPINQGENSPLVQQTQVISPTTGKVQPNYTDGIVQTRLPSANGLSPALAGKVAATGSSNTATEAAPKLTPELQNTSLQQQLPQLQQPRQQGRYIELYSDNFIDPATRQQLNDQFRTDIDTAAGKGSGASSGVAIKYANKRLDDYFGYENADRTQKLGANKLAQDDRQFNYSAHDKANNDAWSRLLGEKSLDYKIKGDEQNAEAGASKLRLDQFNEDRNFNLKLNTPVIGEDAEGNKIVVTPQQKIQEARKQQDDARAAEIAKWKAVATDPKLTDPQKKQDVLNHLRMLERGAA